MFRKLFSYALLSLCPVFVNAADVVYSTTSGSNGYLGTGKAEAYDIAVHLTDTGFVGKSITAVEIPVRQDAAISDYSVFLTKELTLVSKVNTPDIVSVSAEPSDGKLVVKFDEPYTITSDGVYVGYSLTVTSIKDTETDAPSAPIIGEYKTDDNNLFIHTKRSYINWMDKSTAGFTPTINITVSGDIDANSATISLKGGLKGVVASESPITATITNFGSEAINDLDVAYKYADQSGTVHVALTSPIPAQYALSQNVVINLPASQTRGQQELSLTLAKVNGQDNGIANASATSDITFFSFVPKHRAVMEEYTGTWCGWCPRGFAAMQYLNKHQPDFIGIAYHNGDIMTFSEETPSVANGYPSCWLDRTIQADPYYGSVSYTHFAIEDEWLERCEVLAPADIELDAQFDSPDSDIITVNTTLKFCSDYNNAGFKLTYALVADDLYAIDGTQTSRKNWGQSNYYKGDNASDYIDELQQFCEGASTVYGLHFDDVVVWAPEMQGVEGSVPSVIKDSEVIKSTYTIDSSNAVAIYYDNQPIIQDRTKLRVVAMLLDADGVIVNANETKVYGGVEGVSSTIAPNATVVATEYFDLSGRRISNPENGLYIRRNTLSDGTVSTSKLILK